MRLPIVPTLRRTPALRLLLALASVTLSMLVAGGASRAAAPTGPLVAPGRGVWVAGHTGFVGYYRAYVAGHWTKVYCVSPGRAAPSAVTLVSRSRLGGVSLAVTRELAETLSAHGDATTLAQAEAVSQALNEEIGNHAAVIQRAAYLSARVQALAARYVSEASDRRGPYTMGLHLTASPLPGQTGRGLVTLRSAAGGVAQAVTLTHSVNADAPDGVRTNSRGRAWFTYRTIDAGPVRLAARATVPPTTLRVSTPSATTQRMLSWSPAETVHASASYRATGVGFAHRYDCSSACDGHPAVTLTACAPPGTYPARITFSAGAETHVLSFPASPTRTCRSWTGRISDRTTVTAAWQYRTPHGWTAATPSRGTFTVDCPPAPPVAVMLGYDCSTATLAVSLGHLAHGGLVPLRNDSTHDMVLLVGGAVSGRFDVAPGSTSVVHSYPIACGTHSTVTVRGGIARSAGGYNYGQVATIMTP